VVTPLARRKKGCERRAPQERREERERGREERQRVNGKRQLSLNVKNEGKREKHLWNNGKRQSCFYCALCTMCALSSLSPFVVLRP
jgi:hypothetical protein